MGEDGRSGASCSNHSLTKKSQQYSPLNWSIDLLLFHINAVGWCSGDVGFVIQKEGRQKMVGQGQQVPIELLTKKNHSTHHCTGQLTCFFF